MKRQKGGRKWLNPLKLKQEKKTNKEKVGLAAVDKKENKTLGGRSYASVVFGCLTLWCYYIIIMLYYIIHSMGLYCIQDREACTMEDLFCYVIHSLVFNCCPGCGLWYAF